MKDNKLTVVLCGAVIEETIYDKAAKVLEKHGHNITDVVKAFIEGIANGDILINGNHFESTRVIK